MPIEPKPQSASHEHRKLAAIMFTDIKDYSKKMQKSETGALAMLEIHNNMMRETIAKNDGVVIKTVGDAFLVSYDSVISAVKCAVECQENFIEYNKEKSIGSLYKRLTEYVSSLKSKHKNIKIVG